MPHEPPLSRRAAREREALTNPRTGDDPFGAGVRVPPVAPTPPPTSEAGAVDVEGEPESTLPSFDEVLRAAGGLGEDGPGRDRTGAESRSRRTAAPLADEGAAQVSADESTPRPAPASAEPMVSSSREVDELHALFSGEHGAPAIPPAPERGESRRDERSDFSTRRSRRRASSPYSETPKRRSRKGLVAGLLAVTVFIALVAVAVAMFIEPVRALFAEPETTDYVGSGTGQVTFTIHEGDAGSDIANNLVTDDVIKTYEPFYNLLVAKSPEPVFQPGAYQLAGRMSSSAALAALLDPATRLENTFVIPEGTALVDIVPLIADGTGLAAADIESAAADVGSFGLPEGATSLEGFLFPATYTFGPDVSAHDVLQKLVDRMYESLDAAGVAPADRLRVVIFASLVQREAGLAADFPKVARVFQNRLDQNMLLQSDATVAYGTGQTHLVTTTDAERADVNNPYNTYQHLGLPPGAISNPGDIAIDAVMHPADGTWLFFVTVNLDTGETVFSTTLEEHETAVAQWQAWMQDHPEYG